MYTRATCSDSHRAEEVKWHAVFSRVPAVSTAVAPHCVQSSFQSSKAACHSPRLSRMVSSRKVHTTHRLLFLGLRFGRLCTFLGGGLFNIILLLLLILSTLLSFAFLTFLGILGILGILFGILFGMLFGLGTVMFFLLGGLGFGGICRRFDCPSASNLSHA